MSVKQAEGPNGYCGVFTHEDLPFQALVESRPELVVIYRCKTLGDNIEFVTVDGQEITTILPLDHTPEMLTRALEKIMGAV